MKKLKLNKKTVSQLNKKEMRSINGGGIPICLHSCPSGTRRSKKCCGADAVQCHPSI